MWVRRIGILDSIEIEKPGVRDAACLVRLLAVTAIVGKKPGSAEGNNFWSSRKATVDILAESGIELGWCDNIG